MATLDLFDSITTEDAKALLQKSKTELVRQTFRENIQLGTKYLNGQQRDDVRKHLGDRYKEAQLGSTGGQIATQTIPLAQRYVEEAATAYNREVTRALTKEDGTEDDATRKVTDELRRMIDDASYDLTMHELDKNLLVNRTCPLWYQARAGRLRPQVVTADNAYPIPPEERTWFDPADQADYLAHVVKLFGGDGDESRWAWCSSAQTGFYMGRSFDQVNGPIDWRANPYEWPQTYDDDNLAGKTAMLPLQMLTYWHRDKVTGSLMPDVDVEIAQLNREINLQWSMLLDTIAHQGWSQLVLHMANPQSPPQNMPVGSRFALPLSTEESAEMLSSAINYTDLVTALGTFVRLMALALRQSPNDFSIEGSKAMSGFAKLVDSLPKIEARKDRIAVLEQQERDIAWPRLAVIGKHLGKLSPSIEQLAKLRLKVRFADVDIPLSIPEQISKEKHDIELGLTTPAKLLAARDGIGVEEAQAIIDENKAAGGAPQPQPTQGQQIQGQGFLSGLIGRTRRGQDAEP